MGTTGIASRLRSTFSRRRHSITASIVSSIRSVGETSSLGSSRDRGRSQSNEGQDRREPASRRAGSQPDVTPGSSSLSSSQQDHTDNQHGCDSPIATRPPIPASCSESEAKPATTPASSNSSASTGEVPPVFTSTTEPGTATDYPNHPLKPSDPRQSRGGLAPNDQLGNDLQRSWPGPPQPQPHFQSQSQPNSRPSPPHTPELSPASTPKRPRLHSSNPNLGRIHEDSSAEYSTPLARHSGTDADAEAEVETRRHDTVNPDHEPSTPSAATTTTAAITLTRSPSFPPTGVLPSSPSSSPRPPGPPRRQSLLPNRQSTLIKALLHTSPANDLGAEPSPLLPIDANMVTRKIWVKRPHASPTLVTINEDDLVDDVRDLILRKYANSLGRTFDSPDLNIRIIPRDQHKERMLGPEEPMGRTLDAYFPGGQTVEEALIIDIPRRAPKASPRIAGHGGAGYHEEGRPSETGEGYFPPVGSVSSPHPPAAVPAQPASHPPHSIAIIGTGQVPPIPSPGGNRPSRSYRERPERPRLGRTHTSSPTILANGSSNTRQPHNRTLSNSSEVSSMPPPAAPASLPTPPAPEPSQVRVSTPPPARMSSPRPSANRAKKGKKNPEHPTLPPGMLNGGVPPINVLIVEDNPINLKLLEAFVKRLKVRWQTAMNGRDAVKKWRSGGFHLVLMDIQLPVMNGLEATREIRRLERVNSIGVFSSAPDGSLLDGDEENPDELKEQDRLENPSLFKSPVIIVALTASSLQSDRHEALAAGCNDFLTKPVNFVWLERKVMEWGCMQALIDFDGWRKWKVISQEAEEEEAARKAAAAAAKVKAKKNKQQALSSTS